MEKELAQFSLADGEATFLVEVDPPDSPTIERIARVDMQQTVIKAKQSLDDALEQVQPIASRVLTKLRDGLPEQADEIEVTFGLKLNAEAGVVFSSVGGEVTFEVKLKWEKNKDG